MAKLPDGIKAALQEILLPQFDGLRAEVRVIAGQQDEMSKRLDDLRADVTALHARIDQTNARIDQTNVHIEELRKELHAEMVQTNERIDRLLEAMVRRDDHTALATRVGALEAAVDALRRAS